MNGQSRATDRGQPVAGPISGAIAPPRHAVHDMPVMAPRKPSMMPAPGRDTGVYRRIGGPSSSFPFGWHRACIRSCCANLLLLQEVTEVRICAYENRDVVGTRSKRAFRTFWTGWSAEPDVVLPQEIKTVDEFPAMEALGYKTAVHGQKSYNGVVILSRVGLEEVSAFAQRPQDEQARYIEATVGDAGVRVASIICQRQPRSRRQIRLQARLDGSLQHRAAHLLKAEQPVVLGGDYNVIPADEDVHDPVAWEGDALIGRSRAAFRRILWLIHESVSRASHGAASLLILGLSGGAWQGQRYPHRPSSVVSTGGRQVGGL